MEITSRFNRDDFEVWVDHFQYLDIGERHQEVPSGKSFIRGAFDPDQNAYVVNKIHIDPDMLQTDVKEKLMSEAKLQAHKKNKKLLRKRVAMMPVHEPRNRIERNQPEDNRPMIRRDLQTAVFGVANALNESLWQPQGQTPGDKRWQVSGLSHSSWRINHPDIITNGESPLILRIRKLPDNRWAAFGQNRLTNLLNTETLAVRDTPPGGSGWDDIETFAETAAEYFQKQKDNILALKQSMTPQIPPGAMYPGQQQQQGGGGMGGEMGGMSPMGSRQVRRKKAAGEIVPAQPGQQQRQQGATVGGSETAGRVNEIAQRYVSKAMSRASILERSLSDPRSQVRPDLVIRSINDMNNLIHGAAVTTQANLGPQAQGLVQRLATASRYLQATLITIKQAGQQFNPQVLAEITRNLQWFTETLKSTTNKRARRACATLANLRKAKRIAHQIHGACGSQDWYIGVRVVNDRDGIALGLGLDSVPSRRIKGSLEGIPVVLEGPGSRMLQANKERQKRFRLAYRLATEVSEEMRLDPEAERALKHHQRMVKRVYNHIKNSARLSGSMRYLARKLGVEYTDLVRVIGQLIVEGKIEVTKKRKFKLLPEPHTPVPGMQDRFSSTNSVFGLDRGRSDKRVDQLLTQSNFQMNLDEPEPLDGTKYMRDIRERPSKLMPDPTSPN